MPDDATKILIVDDLPEKLLVYQAILGELGETLVTAQSGEEALAHILKDEFAVILLDVQLPGMNGFETAAMIRSRQKSAHTPIIFLTAFADEIRTAEGYAHGAVDYIQTPVVPGILQAKVRVFVDLFRMTRRVKEQAKEHIVLAEERTKRAAAEELGARFGFLAEVSRSLANSLDPDTTALTIARQAVPFLADLAGVTVANEAGFPWHTEIAWEHSTERTIYSRRITETDGPHDSLREAVDRVLNTGSVEWLSGLSIPIPNHNSDAFPGNNELLLHHAAVYPLRARNRVLGALTLAFGPSGRTQANEDRALAEELAARAAVALDNARLFEETRRADRQKNEFLSMLAHELRNPLAPIRNAIEILRLKNSKVPDVMESCAIFDRQVTHLVRLVDDLLDVSRITQGKIRLQFESVDLAELLKAAVETSRPLIDLRQHQLRVTYPDQTVRIHADPTRLGQVFTNLLNNAAKYTESGGHIKIHAEMVGQEAVIRIRDSGIGIPADMLNSVFELFTQVDQTLDRSSGGLGIGLTLVRSLIEKHGGTVTARSEGQNRGSEFEVRLPVESHTLMEQTEIEAPPTQPKSAKRLRILVVDDNVDGAESMAMLLGLMNHEVQISHNGLEALQTAIRMKPEVAILDIGLPGMDGYSLAREMRARPETSETVLIAMTGYGRTEDRDNSLAAGLQFHLVKPVQFEELSKVLASIDFTRLNQRTDRMSKTKPNDAHSIAHV
jgi:signal transduction histidine kinase/DNA-binding response OmpR family regulator